MRKQFTCARGHHWEADLEAVRGVAGMSCPTCGAPAETVDGTPGAREVDPEAQTAVRPPGELPVSTLQAQDALATDREGGRIGPYKLLQKIGEGGMGTVYVAEQEHPVRRRVALKIIKPGMDSRSVLARFEAERQALALMDHPNIAKVLDAGEIPPSQGADAGTSPPSKGGAGGVVEVSPLAKEGARGGGRPGNSPPLKGGAGGVVEVSPLAKEGARGGGRPYFVMELVKGTPITTYCDEHRLPLERRLELFVQVCHALQHAHQKGIIHRDVKPSNVLVAPYDGRPVVKVIDFGVAKAMGQQLTDRTLYTEIGAVVGTLQYMSPEQAELNNLDIDTRSDVYSLGVLLYELLTGTTPLEKNRLRGEVMALLLAAIHQEEPPKPSTRLRQSRDSLPTIAAQRQIEPDRLTKLIRGDLDWIVMKALAKDRDQRYASANGLARDVERYLANEPVEASPPSTTYRLRKFASKHRSAFVTATAFAALLVAGLAASTWQAIRATRAETAAWMAVSDAEQARAAEAEQRRRAEDNERRATERETETQAVLDFVESRIFAAARPAGQQGGLGYDVKLADAIKQALPFVEKSFPHQPLIEARLRMTIGASFACLGALDEAEMEFARARQLYTAKLGPDHPDTLTSMHNIACSYGYLGRHAEALKLHEETLQLRKTKFGPDHPDTLTSMLNLSSCYTAIGRSLDAVKVCEEALPIMKAKMPEHALIFNCMNNLANGYESLGRHAEALKLREETLQLRKTKLGPDHPDTLWSMHNIACSYNYLNRHAEALKLHEETLQLRKAKLGPDHPATLTSTYHVAYTYNYLGRHAEALKLHEETLRLRKARLGPDHPDTLWSMHHIASSYHALGRPAEALKLHEETLELRKAKLGPDHPDTLMSMNNLAGSYYALGRHAEALKLFEETHPLMKAKLGPDHPDTLMNTYLIACSYYYLGRHAEALKLHEETLQLRKASLGPDHPDTLWSMHDTASSYQALGRSAEALKLLEDTLQLGKAKLGPDHPVTLQSMQDIAISYHALGRPTEALKLHEETFQLRKSKLGPDHPDTLMSMHFIACSYNFLNRHAEALKLHEETFQLRKARLGLDHPDTLRSLNNLASSYYALGRHAEALKLFEETHPLLKAKLGPDHPDTLSSMHNLACSLLNLVGRRAEAIPLIDDFVARAARQQPLSHLVGNAMVLRLGHFEKLNDAQGCQATAEIWEKLHRTDGDSLYLAAVFRAVAAKVAKGSSTADAERLASEHANQAMAWLKQAVAAGYKNLDQLRGENRLDALRDREDFRKLLGDVEANLTKPEKNGTHK